MSAPTLSRPPASPAAVRTARPGWRDPRLALGVGLVAVCALVGARLLDGAERTVAVWAVRSDLVSGQALTAADLETAHVHFGSPDDADRYLSAGSAVPSGVVLRRAVGAGELLPRGALGSASEADLVQLPITVLSQAVPATVKAGSVVDVWVTEKDAGQAVLVLEDVAVLALPASGGSLSPSADRQVIVGVAKDQQTDLPSVLARLASGTVVIAGRSGG